MEITFEQMPKLLAEIYQKIDDLANNISQKNEPKNPYKDITEAAAFIKKSKAALRQVVYRGELRYIKRGNSLMFRENDLIEWLEGGSRKSKAELKIYAEDILVKKERGSSN